MTTPAPAAHRVIEVSGTGARRLLEGATPGRLVHLPREPVFLARPVHRAAR